MERVRAPAVLGKKVVRTQTRDSAGRRTIATFAWSGMAAAESEEAGTELQNYFSNANTTGGQAYVNIIPPSREIQRPRPPTR